MTMFVLAILFILALSYLSRMCGGAPPKLPYGLDQWLYAIPFAVNAAVILTGLPLWLEIILVATSYAGAFVGKRTGHGGGMDDARSEKEPGAGRTLEKVEYLIYPWLYKKVSRKLYDFVLVTLTGLAVTLASAIAFFYNGSILSGIVMIISGGAKGIAYQIGWKLFDMEKAKGYVEIVNGQRHMKRYPKYLDEATAIGEFLTGTFNALGIIGALVVR